MSRKFWTGMVGALVLVVGLTISRPGDATLALTPDGIADGFTLTTFVSGYPFATPPGSDVYGPLAQGIASTGNVITGSTADLKIYIFKDVDNQTLANALSATPYAPADTNPQYAITTAGGQVYGAQLSDGSVFPSYEHFNSDGTHSPIPGLPPVNLFGEWGNPVNGHIIASSALGLIDIDPVAHTFRVIAPLLPACGTPPLPNGCIDGVTVSPDGKTVYAAVTAGNILAYDIASGTLLHTFPGNGFGPDGLGVISGGEFNGDIIANNNNGTVGLIDVTTGVEDIIASGGTRGDFVSPDPSNGTLFLSQNERVDRLGCGPGCSIGSPLAAPEPASFALFAGALLSFAGFRRSRQR